MLYIITTANALSKTLPRETTVIYDMRDTTGANLNVPETLKKQRAAYKREGTWGANYNRFVQGYLTHLVKNPGAVKDLNRISWMTKHCADVAILVSEAEVYEASTRRILANLFRGAGIPADEIISDSSFKYDEQNLPGYAEAMYELYLDIKNGT